MVYTPQIKDIATHFKTCLRNSFRVVKLIPCLSICHFLPFFFFLRTGLHIFPFVFQRLLILIYHVKENCRIRINSFNQNRPVKLTKYFIIVIYRFGKRLKIKFKRICPVKLVFYKIFPFQLSR